MRLIWEQCKRLLGSGGVKFSWAGFAEVGCTLRAYMLPSWICIESAGSYLGVLAIIVSGSTIHTLLPLTAHELRPYLANFFWNFELYAPKKNPTNFITLLPSTQLTLFNMFGCWLGFFKFNSYFPFFFPVFIMTHSHGAVTGRWVTIYITDRPICLPFTAHSLLLSLFSPLSFFLCMCHKLPTIGTVLNKA